MAGNIVFTPAAQKFMRRMVRLGGASGFRLSVTAGGCSGLDASFDLPSGAMAGDEVVELEGLRVFLPAESRILLDGVTVDFADAAASSGFTFINPNAGACGCATSAPPPGPMVTRVSLDAIGGRTAKA